MTEKKQRKNDRKYERKYDREKYFCFEFFLSLNISDFSLFFMKNLQSLLKKVTPLFPRKPLSKLQSRQAPMFENLVGDSTSHPTTTTTPTKKWGCTRWVRSVSSYLVLEEIFLHDLQRHTPIKQKVTRANNAPYVTIAMRKAIMQACKQKFLRAGKVLWS